MSLATTQVRSFFEMMALTVAHNRHSETFSNEMLLAIFWEASFFQNILRPTRSGAGPAAGFGRLEAAGVRPANFLHTQQFPNDTHPYNLSAILQDERLSVAVTADCLEGLSRMNEHMTPAAVLEAYAGPNSTHLPARWLACETELKAVLQGFTFDPLKWDPVKIEGALRKARWFPSSGPQYFEVHDQLFPYEAILSFLFGGSPFISQGAVGRAVWGIQELMNQAAHRQVGGSGQPPLTVDGQFGFRTSARVKEFQSRNGLTADGVVGPQTRERLLQIA